MSATINVTDLTPEQRSALGIKKPRNQTFTKEDVRSQAIRVLHPINHLTKSERKRVLNHALKLNEL